MFPVRRLQVGRRFVGIGVILVQQTAAGWEFWRREQHELLRVARGEGLFPPAGYGDPLPEATGLVRGHGGRALLFRVVLVNWSILYCFFASAGKVRLGLIIDIREMSIYLLNQSPMKKARLNSHSQLKCVPKLLHVCMGVPQCPENVQVLLHAVWFIRNTVKFRTVLFLNFHQKWHIYVAYFWPNCFLFFQKFSIVCFLKLEGKPWISPPKYQGG